MTNNFSKINKREFKTFGNSGRISGRTEYSNQCMWISLLNYLNDVLGNNLSIDDIRDIASSNNTPINNIDEQFDFMVHSYALFNVLESFDLQLHIYIPARDDENNKIFINDNLLVLGNIESNNIVSIVSYGSHFELITQIENRKLYNNKMAKMNTNNFVPNISLATGCDNISSLSIELINKIISLIDIKDSLTVIVHTLMNEIKDISSKEVQYKNIGSLADCLSKEEQEQLNIQYEYCLMNLIEEKISKELQLKNARIQIKKVSNAIKHKLVKIRK